jgi:hypothetical protein
MNPNTKTTVLVAALAVITLNTLSVAQAAEPVTERSRILFIGGYQSGFDDMPQMTANWLQQVDFGAAVEYAFLSSDAHGTPTSNHRQGLMTWIRGTGDLAASRNPKYDAPYAQGRIQAANFPADVPVDLIFNGFIKIETPGAYRFFGVRGSDMVQAELSIAGRTLHPRTPGDCVLEGLAPGWHAVQGRFRTREGWGETGMLFDPGWSLPGQWPIRKEMPRENIFWCRK